MSKYKWTAIALILLVIFDALGDGFRLQQWMIIHHSMETIVVAGWILIWATLKFDPVFIVMYILCRFVLFDLTFNLTVGNAWWYIGESSLYGRGLAWLAGVVKQPLPVFTTVPKIMALIWWVAWFVIEKKFNVTWNSR